MASPKPCPSRSGGTRGQSLAMPGCSRSAAKWPLAGSRGNGFIVAGWWGCCAPFATGTWKAGEGLIVLQLAVVCSIPVLYSHPPKKVLLAHREHRSQSHKEASLCPGAVADPRMELAWCLLSLLGFMMSFFLCWPSPAAVFACGLGRRG